MAEETKYETVVLEERHEELEPEIECVNDHSNTGKIVLASLGALGALGIGAAVLCRKKLGKIKQKKMIKKLEKRGFTVTANEPIVIDDSEEDEPEEE